MRMDRVNRILSHPVFCGILRDLDQLERDREFCRHGLDHLLDVARILTLRAGEQGSEIPRDVLYAAALVHDLGRGEQYRTGTPHERAAAGAAGPILAECGYTPAERKVILSAVAGHRTPDSGGELGRHLYWADKKSRPCWACPAAGACNWPAEQKNYSLEF